METRSPALQVDSLLTEAQGKPKNTGAGPFSSQSSQPGNQTGVSCIAGRFFTKWAIREALQQEEAPQWEACAPQLESSLYSPQLKKSLHIATKTQNSQK